MQGRVLVVVSAGALLAALSVGPFGTAAGAPWVYGCTPANHYNNNNVYGVLLTIYNGSASTANLTHKILAGDGTNLNVGAGVGVTSTLPATHTTTRAWITPGTLSQESSSTAPSSVRVVSDQPVFVSFTHNPGAFDYRTQYCGPQQQP